MHVYTYQTRYNTPTIPTTRTALVHNPLLHTTLRKRPLVH